MTDVPKTDGDICSKCGKTRKEHIERQAGLHNFRMPRAKSTPSEQVAPTADVIKTTQVSENKSEKSNIVIPENDSKSPQTDSEINDVLIAKAWEAWKNSPLTEETDKNGTRIRTVVSEAVKIAREYEREQAEAEVSARKKAEARVNRLGAFNHELAFLNQYDEKKVFEWEKSVANNKDLLEQDALDLLHLSAIASSIVNWKNSKECVERQKERAEKAEKERDGLRARITKATLTDDEIETEGDNRDLFGDAYSDFAAGARWARNKFLKALSGGV